jgi:hypothetical protein
MMERLFLRSRIVGTFCLILLGALVGYFLPQALEWSAALKRDRANIGLWAVPKTLDDATVATAPGTALSCFGHEFEVPWVGIEKETKDAHSVRIRFKSGQELLVIDSQADDLSDTEKKTDEPLFHRAFGSNVAGTKYEHLKDVLEMTPTRLSPFRMHKDFARDLYYLESKELSKLSTQQASVFSLDTRSFRGFEIRLGRETILALFDDSDRELHFVISAPAQLAQPEINRIIQTLAPTRRDLHRESVR